MSTSQFAGGDWIECNFPEIQLSELGYEVANLLGDLYYGIYHLDNSALVKADWDNGHCVTITVWGDLATFDTDGLTRLVVMCHDRLLRCSIRGVGNGYMRLMFHKRKGRTGKNWERHPTIEDAIMRVRASLEV